MHTALAEEMLKEVRGRISEGDHPTTPPLPVEQLEDLANTLAYDRDRRIADLERQLAEARSALEFYADDWITDREGQPYEPTDLLWDDKGERARAALSPQKKMR